MHRNPRIKKLAEIFSRKRAQRLLDIGCGSGAVGLYISKCCASIEVYGLDVSATAVEQANARGMNAMVADVDSQDLPFSDNMFDAVLAQEVIEHIVDTDHLLEEIRRVMSPDGFAVITTPNLSSWLNRLLLLFGYQPRFTEVSLRHNVGKPMARRDEVSGHIRSFAFRSLRELLQVHGFRIVGYAGAGYPHMLPFPLSLFERLSERRPSLAAISIFVCMK